MQRTILLVDDEEAIRALVSSVLEDAGHPVLAASSGEEALRRLAAYPGPVDLLLTDVGLPGMDGLALAERVIRMRPGIRVLLTSGYSAALAVGGKGVPAWAEFLAKPYAPPALLRKLAGIFGAEEPAPPRRK